MSSYDISNIGLLDLKEIYEYGVYRFGTKQAINFLEELESQFELLASNPLIGRKRPELDPLVYTFSYKSYIIIYEIIHGKVFIDRVLHGSKHIDNLFTKR